jgi:hypothetical protein
VDQLIVMLIVWLSAHTGLPEPQDLPIVRQSSPQILADLRYREAGVHRRREVVGVYVDTTATIHLSESWDSRNVADVSILVHELVHHLQNVADLTYDCPAAREKLAYQAQAHWLAMFGHSLEDDFGLDAMTLKLTTECLYP